MLNTESLFTPHTPGALADTILGHFLDTANEPIRPDQPTPYSAFNFDDSTRFHWIHAWVNNDADIKAALDNAPRDLDNAFHRITLALDWQFTTVAGLHRLADDQQRTPHVSGILHRVLMDNTLPHTNTQNGLIRAAGDVQHSLDVIAARCESTARGVAYKSHISPQDRAWLEGNLSDDINWAFSCLAAHWQYYDTFAQSQIDGIMQPNTQPDSQPDGDTPQSGPYHIGADDSTSGYTLYDYLDDDYDDPWDDDGADWDDTDDNAPDVIIVINPAPVPQDNIARMLSQHHQQGPWVALGDVASFRPFGSNN